MREQEALRSRARRVHISVAGPRVWNLICMSVYLVRKVCRSDDLIFDQCRCREVLLSANSGLSALSHTTDAYLLRLCVG